MQSKCNVPMQAENPPYYIYKNIVQLYTRIANILNSGLHSPFFTNY